MEEGSDYFQSEESGLGLVRMIPFFAEGPWRYIGSSRDVVMERLPVEIGRQVGSEKRDGVGS
jgi:hypothetical protein